MRRSIARRLSVLLLAAGAAAMLAACSDWPSPHQPKVPDPLFQLPVAPAKAVRGVEARQPDPEDLIQPGDSLEVTVRRGGGEEKYPVTVRQNGLITVAFTDIDVRGLDEAAAEARITREIAPFIKQPRVQVRLLKGAERERFIYVTGEVRRGGKLKMSKRTTILSAVAIGEGFSDIADMSKIVVISPREGHKNLVRVADIENALKTGDMSADLQLQDGDIVFVPRSRMGDWSVYYNRALSPVLNSLLTASNIVFINKALYDLFNPTSAQTQPTVPVCWVARALYGDDAWQPKVLRWYLLGPFSDHWYGRLFADLYVEYGERVADLLKRHEAAQALVRPLFDRLLERAVEAADRRLPGFAAAAHMSDHHARAGSNMPATEGNRPRQAPAVDRHPGDSRGPGQALDSASHRNGGRGAGVTARTVPRPARAGGSALQHAGASRVAAS